VLVIRRKILYKVKEIKAGQIFGAEEMLLGLSRRCRITALSHCNVIYLNKQDFKLAFPMQVQKDMKAAAKDMDLGKILDKINKYYKQRKLNNSAILDAT